MAGFAHGSAVLGIGSISFPIHFSITFAVSLGTSVAVGFMVAFRFMLTVGSAAGFRFTISFPWGSPEIAFATGWFLRFPGSLLLLGRGRTERECNEPGDAECEDGIEP